MIKKKLRPMIIYLFQQSIVKHFFSFFSRGCKVLYHHGVEKEILNSQIQNVHWSFQDYE